MGLNIYLCVCVLGFFQCKFLNALVICMIKFRIFETHMIMKLY